MTAQPLVTDLRTVFKKIDELRDKEVASALSQHPGTSVSCRRGCSHCCHQLTVISVPEGILLATTVLAHTGWRTEILPALAAAAHADCTPKLTKRSRFRSQVPCGLLDTKTGECRAYADRPGCCRLHVVVSPVANCSLEGNEHGETKTAAFNMLEIEAALWEITAQMSNAVGANPVEQAPISLMTIACLLMLLPRDSADFALVRDVAKTLPSPATWIHAHVHDLHEEDEHNRVDNGANGSSRVEQLHAIGRRMQKTVDTTNNHAQQKES